MVDYIIGLLLLGLGLRPVAGSVLGDAVHPAGVTTSLLTTTGQAPTSTATATGTRVLRAVLTKDQEDAFQASRQKREKTIASVSEKRASDLKTAFAETLKQRLQRDYQAQQALRVKVQAFTDTKKKQRVLTIASTFESLGTDAVTAMQEKLTGMLTLLDKISVAAAALSEQGKDTSNVDSDITAAQAKITTALTLATNTAEAMPGTISVTSETTAKSDIQTSISDLTIRLTALHSAYEEARNAVGKALTDLKVHTQPVDVTGSEADQ